MMTLMITLLLVTLSSSVTVFAAIEPMVIFSPSPSGKCQTYNECPGVGGKSVCCPFSNGVCCGSRLFLPMKGFCCPQGHDCGRQDQCLKRPSTKQNNVKIEDLLFVPRPVPRSLGKKNVLCPDGQSHCTEGQTCCKMTDGSMGCCPYQSAVCCKDGKHCCPPRTICDEAQDTCTPSFITFYDRPIIPKRKLPARPIIERQVHAGYVVCPDGSSECADGQTCCIMSDGSYGCCPFPRGQCCNDGVHCCPENTQCDDESTRCVKKSSLENLLFRAKQRVKEPSFKVPHALAAVWNRPDVPFRNPSFKRRNTVLCGNGESMCHDWETCCKYPDGSWGCCPMANASCCPNGLACCPQSYTCDSTSSHCTHVNRHRGTHYPIRRTSPVRKTPALRVPKSLVCPDGVSVCPDSYTCCQLVDDSWGCCPLPEAVCCSDHTHCCPYGYTCNAQNVSCDQQRGLRIFSVPMKQKMTTEKAATESQSSFIQSYPTNSPKVAGINACQALGLPSCSTGIKGTRCCPFTKGVCCADGNLCCPSGYTCAGNSGCLRKRD